METIKLDVNNYTIEEFMQGYEEVCKNREFDIKEIETPYIMLLSGKLAKAMATNDGSDMAYYIGCIAYEINAVLCRDAEDKTLKCSYYLSKYEIEDYIDHDPYILLAEVVTHIANKQFYNALTTLCKVSSACGLDIYSILYAIIETFERASIEYAKQNKE